MVIAIIIPAHNEQLTIARVVRQFHAELPNAQIWVIDNCSTDGTAETARATFTELGCPGGLLQEWRKGKGFAVRRAFYDVDADIYVMVDADLTYPTAAVHELLEPVTSGKADMVVGDRFPMGTYRAATGRRFHRSGNVLVRMLINFLFNCQLRDIMSGYRVMSRRLVKLFPILSSGFQLETELTIHAIDKEFVIREMPVAYAAREEGSSSKLSTVRDGLRILKLVFFLFKTYRPMPFFLSIAAFFFLTSLVVAFPVIREFILTGLVLRIPSAILATGLMVCAGLSTAIALIMDSLVNDHRFTYEQKVMEYMTHERTMRAMHPHWPIQHSATSPQRAVSATPTHPRTAPAVEA